MATPRYHKSKIGEHELQAETLMLSYGYDPSLSEGSVKPPVFLTSTFVFETAEQGRDFFDYMAGRQPLPADAPPGLVYSRFNHPNLEIVEDRLAIHEKAEAGLVFASGMAAIATLMFAYVRPGEFVLHSRPLYGGTEVLIARTLAPLGVKGVGFTDGLDAENIRAAAKRASAEGRIAIIFIETPSNPMNSLVDIALVRQIAEEIGHRQGVRPIVCCDNTLLGPVFQSPLAHGADLSLYSLTKYVGGHSDLIGGRSQTRAHHAQRHRHAARSALLLDADALPRDAIAAHGACGDQRRNRGAFLVGTSKSRPRALPASPGKRPPGPSADGAPIQVGGIDFLVRRRRRPGGSFRLSQPSANLQARRQPRRHGVAHLPSRDNRPFRLERGGAARDRDYAVAHTHVDRHRARQ
jgi:hypothetical protein